MGGPYFIGDGMVSVFQYSFIPSSHAFEVEADLEREGGRKSSRWEKYVLHGRTALHLYLHVTWGVQPPGIILAPACTAKQKHHR